MRPLLPVAVSVRTCDKPSHAEMRWPYVRTWADERAARLGRRHLRSGRRSPDTLGPRRPRSAAARGRRDGPRRRAAAAAGSPSCSPSASRTVGSSPSTRRRRWSTRPAGAWPGSPIASTSSSPTSDGRSRLPRRRRRRDPLDRDVPLGARSRRALPRTWRPSSGRAAASSPSAAAAGNIASIRAILATIGDGWLGDAHFETPEATAERLAAAGFVDVETWLQPEPTRFERRRAARDVPPDGGPRGPRRAAAAEPNATPSSTRSRAVWPSRSIDYVRLNIAATRA